MSSSRRRRSFTTRIKALIAAAGLAGALAVVLPMSSATAAPACEAAWSTGTAYTGGDVVSHSGHNWEAKWWTRGETPGTTGQWGVWADQGTCGTGDGGGDTDPDPSGFIVSQAQFDQMFPTRNSFYTYGGLVDALSAYPAFTNTGSQTVRLQEAAAFLANVSHETGGLRYIVEQNEANYPHYCDESQPYGCPAGNDAYYGRGPIQLSWNFNYKAAGDALGIDLLNNPWQVENDSATAWKTALWYWNTQSGPGTYTGHEAITGGHGFGESIRSINGALECDGGNPAQVQSRIDKYKAFTQILGTTPGGNLSC